MALRESMPAPWMAAATVLAGLVAGVILARARPTADRAPDPVPVPVAAPPVPSVPPAEIARAMEPDLAAAFLPGEDDPEALAARDAAFGRLRESVARWAAVSPRPPLGNAAWWRAALRRAQPTGEGDRRGLCGGAIRWGGRPFPVLFSVPEGPGPFPAVIALVDEDPRAVVDEGWGKLLETHLVAIVPRRGILVENPRLALLALGEAGRRWGVDRDRVVLDGTGAAAREVAAMASEESSRLCGVVVRGPFVPAGPAENLARLPVLAALPGKTSEEAQDWIAALPPRPGADPRNPVSWATVTGKGFKGWGPGFVVRRPRGAEAGRPVRVFVERDPGRNAVVLRTENVAEILLLLTDEGLDLDRPVVVVADGRVVATRIVERSLDTLRTWALQEPGLLVVAEMEVRLDE